MLELVEKIHGTGYTHGNVKGGNFIKRETGELYLIDFEVSRRWMCFETGKHLSKKELKVNKYQGNRLYRSSFVDYSEPISRRAEIESVCYVLWRVWSGSLPWETWIEDREKVMEIKRGLEVEKIEEIPVFLREWLTVSRKLEFEEDPPYELYRELLEDLEEKNGEKAL